MGDNKQKKVAIVLFKISRSQLSLLQTNMLVCVFDCISVNLSTLAPSGFLLDALSTLPYLCLHAPPFTTRKIFSFLVSCSTFALSLLISFKLFSWRHRLLPSVCLSLSLMVAQKAEKVHILLLPYLFFHITVHY